MFGILSINDRNINYIKKLNPSASVNLADNKIETKHFLSERGIGVARTFAVISNKKELSKFNFSSINSDDFVIKPVYGSRGRGILIVKKLGNGKFSIQGEIFDEKYLLGHMYDILNGDYSMSYGYDKILIEEKLIPGGGFEKFCELGLADIRVIVYNMVPVATMLRMPSEISGGKANLKGGGYGLGIEVGTGRVYSLYQHGKVYTKEFPVRYADLKDFIVPFWDDILLASSKIQFFVNLGYLALDWVVTESGPKILEINARAGMEIQNVCLLPLKKRLDKLKDLKIQEPEKGVELAKSLFSEKVATGIDSKKVVYLDQYADLIVNGEKEEIIVKVDLIHKKNIVSSDIKKFIGNNNFSLKLGDNLLFEDLKYSVEEDLDEGIMILGSETLKDYFVKPVSNLEKKKLFIPKKINKNELDVLKSLDEKVTKLDKKFSFTSTIKPINFLGELNKFVELKGDYNPQFEYNFLSEEKISMIKESIKALKNTYFKKDLELKSEFANIFLDKLDEIQDSINLLEAYSKQDFEKINKYNVKLYGEIDDKLLEKAKQKSQIIVDRTVLGKKLSVEEVVDCIKNYLESKQIKQQVKIIPYTSNTSRISVTRKKGKIEIKIDANSIFREKEIEGILAHEIGTHLVRFLNGKDSGWEIFSSGTAGYIATEEGLAVHNSLQFMPENYEKIAMFQEYYLLEMAKKLDFKDLAKIAFKFYGNDYVKVFKMTTRFKRGITDTSVVNEGAYYAKDKVYLDGYYKIKDWIKEGGDIEKLMIGKVKIRDLKYIW